MRISITHRIFLAMLAAAGSAVVCMFLITQWSIEYGFRRYVSSQEQTQIAHLVEQLEQGYSGQGSWDFLKKDSKQWQRIIAASFFPGGPGPLDREPPGPPWHEYLPNRPEGRDVGPMYPPPPPPEFGGRFYLLDAGKRAVWGPIGISDHDNLKELRYHNQIVGYLGVQPHRHFSDKHQIRFLNEQKLALAMVTGMVVVLATGMSLPLANRLVKPIKALATATNYLSAGKFDTRVPVVSVDELGRLARNFNELAITLEKNEHTRRHWVADISHELRTPLAVLRGEIEAIQDGIRQPTSEAISSLHSETLRLGRLVEDLYQLSLFDLGGLTYRKAELDCAMMLNQTVESFRPEFTAHNIELHCELPKGNFSPLFADGERLRQLFHNILENSLKYTDPQGTLIVHLDYTTTDVQISFQDSAPGVPPESVERLFDRLYRVETSRNRATGGAGLGLAICKNIVEAHHGSIQAKQSPLGGLWLLVTLPLKGTVS